MGSRRRGLHRGAGREAWFPSGAAIATFSYSMLKQRANAIEDLGALLRARPEASALVFRGNQYLLLNQFAAAAADFGEAIRLNPKSSGIYEMRAQARLKLGDRTLLDGTLNGIGSFGQFASGVLGKVQNGSLHMYALLVLVGAVGALLWSWTHA